jgi:hypothetical protein
VRLVVCGADGHAADDLRRHGLATELALAADVPAALRACSP